MPSVNKLVRRKPLAFVVTALSMGALATGCGGAPAATKATPSTRSFAGQTLTVFDGAPAGADAKQTQEYYNELAALFHRKTGATLHWQYYSTPAQEVTKIETSTVSGSGPDIISYGTSFVGTLMATGDFPLLSASNWKTLGGKSSFVTADLFDSGTSSTKEIGVPYETNPFVLAYNTEDFKKAGITSAPRTWTQVVDDAQIIQRKINGVYGVGFDPQDSYDPWKNLYFIDKQLGGGHWISPNGKKIQLDTATMQKAVAFYFSLDYRFHVVPPESMTWNSADLASAFMANKVAMSLLAGYGYTAAAQGTPLQGHVGYALLPDVPYHMTSLPKGAKPIETETTGNYWAIPGYAASKRQLALEFEKLSLSPQIQLAQFKLLGWIPVNHAGVKAVEAYSKTAVPFVKAEASAYPTSIAPVWSYVETGIETALNNIASHLATSGGQWNQAYANQQLANAQSAAQAHA